LLFFPSSISFYERVCFNCCLCNIFSSKEQPTISLNIWTYFFWPCLQILPITWLSLLGFQSGSIIIILQAQVKVKPVPPALPESNNTSLFLKNPYMILNLSWPSTLPSNFATDIPYAYIICCTKSRVYVKYEFIISFSFYYLQFKATCLINSILGLFSSLHSSKQSLIC